MSDKQNTLVGHRLISTKYPPIALFDDVASPEEFDMLYAIQSLTNPRLFDAVAPFTHINPNGGRFNDGLFGALYIASTDQTAAIEVKYHQQKYWQNIEGLAYDRFLFRNLLITHKPSPVYVVDSNDAEILNPDNYSASQQLARNLKKESYQAVEYSSVRSENGICWALFTPKPVCDVVQSYLLEMIWDGDKIAEVNKVQHMVDLSESEPS
ncbi:RES family NAD+ phosphorylase [Aliivibrio sp.]|uniref:RES family NAD+ phosphorylase n=1 Tax=Aliivibrio sp. TaxID=1872443 RepID=UPI003D2ED651